MSNFVNKVKLNNVEYDINDARIVVAPANIVTLVDKAEKTAADCLAIYNYLLSLKDVNPIVELRGESEIKRITEIEYKSNEIDTNLFVVKTDDFDVVEVQAKLTAGSNITIADNVISATDTKYTAGSGISIVDDVISATGGSGGIPMIDASDCAYVGQLVSLLLGENWSFYGIVNIKYKQTIPYTATLYAYNCVLKVVKYTDTSFDVELLMLRENINTPFEFSTAHISTSLDSDTTDISTLLSYYNCTPMMAVPIVPSDASTKTYVLKIVNGTLGWVEEQVQ